MVRKSILSRRVRNGIKAEKKICEQFHLKLVHLTWDAEMKKDHAPELPSRFVEIKSIKDQSNSVRIGEDQLAVLKEKDGVFIFFDRYSQSGYIVMAKNVPKYTFRWSRLVDGTIKVWGQFSLK